LLTNKANIDVMDRPLYKEAFAWHDSNIMAMRFDLSAEKQIICGFQRYIRPETKVKWDMHYPLELGIVLSGKIKRYYSNWKKIYHPGEVWYNTPQKLDHGLRWICRLER